MRRLITTLLALSLIAPTQAVAIEPDAHLTKREARIAARDALLHIGAVLAPENDGARVRVGMCRLRSRSTGWCRGRARGANLTCRAHIRVREERTRYVMWISRLRC
jgi:hypothetical protein